MDPGLLEQVATTHRLFSTLLSKPRVTTQLLAKPPVKFIRDIFIEVSVTTGCGQGLFTREEIQGAVSSRESKLVFLTVLLHFVASAVRDPELLLQVRVGKVVAGLEPERTNLLLQRLHEAAMSPDCCERWQHAIVEARGSARAAAAEAVAAARAAAAAVGGGGGSVDGLSASAEAGGASASAPPQVGCEEMDEEEEGRLYSTPSPKPLCTYVGMGDVPGERPTSAAPALPAPPSTAPPVAQGGPLTHRARRPVGPESLSRYTLEPGMFSPEPPSTPGRRKSRSVSETLGLTSPTKAKEAWWAQSQPQPGMQDAWQKLLLAEGYGGLEDGRLARLAKDVAKFQVAVRNLLQGAADEGYVEPATEGEFGRFVLGQIWPSIFREGAGGQPDGRLSGGGVRPEPEAEVSPSFELHGQKVQDGTTAGGGGGGSPESRPKLKCCAHHRKSVDSSQAILAIAHASSGAAPCGREQVVMSKRDFVRSNIKANLTRNEQEQVAVQATGVRLSMRKRSSVSAAAIADSHATASQAKNAGETAAATEGEQDEDGKLDANLLLARLLCEKTGRELIESVENALENYKDNINLELTIEMTCATPLHYATAFLKSPGLVKLLVDAHAEVRSTFQGLDVWHGLRPGQTVLEFATAKKIEHQAKGWERWEAIEELLKAEIDRLRGWQTGRRSVRSNTLLKQRLKLLSHQEYAASEDSCDSDDMLDDEEVDTSKHVAPGKRGRRLSNQGSYRTNLMRSLYHAKAGYLCEHYECHPKELFDMQNKVGEGTFGSVWKSVHKGTGCCRAIKALPKMLLEDLSLWSEIAIMRQLDHPHIMKLYATFEDHHSVYIVCELCSGGQLFDAIIKAGSLCERTAAQMMKQILTAVCYLHQRHICHRDLKPENFMIAHESQLEDVHIKLIDFGTAKRFDLEEMTTKVCTVHYVAPELLKNQPVPYTEKCDVWSCGIILFVMLCGCPPFAGGTDMDVLKKVKKGRFAFRPKQVWDHVSMDACHIVNTMLTVKVKDRCTADQAAHDDWVQSLAPNSTGNNLANGRILSKMRTFYHYNKLKKVALQVIAQQLSDKSIESLRETFIAMDSELRGALSVRQMEDTIARLVCDGETQMELMNQMHELAGDTGEINYTQFLAANIDRQLYLQDEACKAAFALFDIDGDGQISIQDLETLFSSSDEAKTDHLGKSACELMGVESEEIQRIMRESDEDGNGNISFHEFVSMLARKKTCDHARSRSIPKEDPVLDGDVGQDTSPKSGMRLSVTSASGAQGEVFNVGRGSTIEKSPTVLLMSRSGSKEGLVEPSIPRHGSKRISGGRCSSVSTGGDGRGSPESARPKMMKSPTVIFGAKGRTKVGTLRGENGEPLLDDSQGISGSAFASEGEHVELPGPNMLWEVFKEKNIDIHRLKDLLQGEGARYVNCWLNKDAGVPPALFFAVTLRLPEMVKLLIKHRADVRRKFDGDKQWKSVRIGQTPLDVNQSQKGRYIDTVLFERCEAIESLMKAEEDRLRGWKGGRRVSAAAKRYFDIHNGGDEDEDVSIAKLETEENRIMLALQNQAKGDESKGISDDILSKKTLYSATAVFFSEHVDGDPAEFYAFDKNDEDGKAGEGTFGVVWRAVERTSRFVRAIKGVPKALLEESDLWQEIELMREMDHPHVGRLYSTHEDSEMIYMIMENCSGGELFAAIEAAGTFSESTAATIFQQMLLGVCYIHHLSICHRDLKPENFLLSRGGPVERATVKLIDFGTARRYGPNNPMSTKICTIHYVAPEILVRMSESYTEKCDIWSLGICLYLMLCGDPPFCGDTDMQVLKKVRKGRFRFEPEVFWDVVQDGAKTLISSLLVVNTDDRLSAQQALDSPFFKLSRLSMNTPSSEQVWEVVPKLQKFWNNSWLKRKSMELVAYQSSSEDEERDASDLGGASLRSLWFYIDRAHRGKIGADDLARAVASAGEGGGDMAPKQLLLEELKASGLSVEVGYTTFAAAMLDREGYTDAVRCRAAFDLLDLDGDGLIKLMEFTIIMQSEEMDEKSDGNWQLDDIVMSLSNVNDAFTERAMQMLRMHDLNGDGAIDFDEFFMMMRAD